MKRWILRGWICITTILSLYMVAVAGALAAEGRLNEDEAISGIVKDANGPVAGAVVRIQTTQHATRTDAEGRFTLSVSAMGQGPFNLTAWAIGYFATGPVQANAGQKDVGFVLTAHATEDNPDYQWSAALCPSNKTDDPDCCSACHSRVGMDLYPFLPVDEWLLDAHSRSAVNQRFISLYTGAPIEAELGSSSGNSSSKDDSLNSKGIDPLQSICGPGFKRDFPDSAGNCGACHVPAAAVSEPFGVDPTAASGVAAEGVTCDFCHKVWDVHLNPSTGLPYDKNPGVLSYEFRRPFEGQQFFAGPFDDVAPGFDTFSAVQKQSQYCGPCHYGTFNGTIIYNSFGEWLQSPYSDPASAIHRTCQNCHMPTGRTCLFTLPEKGGRFRDPATIASHLMPGGFDQEHLKIAASLQVASTKEAESVAVEVRVKNRGAGHHLPTGIPLRHVMVVVSAKDARGVLLSQSSGPRLPLWTGSLSGRAGRVYAKILEDLGTRKSPTAAFWRPTRILADTRLPALETDVSRYTFEATDAGPIDVEVRLIYRRAYHELATLMGWDTADIVMAAETVAVPGSTQ